MSPDRGTVPPVPAQYGALDGGPPRVEASPRAQKRRGSPLGRLARAIGADHSTAPAPAAPAGAVPDTPQRPEPAPGRPTQNGEGTYPVTVYAEAAGATATTPAVDDSPAGPRSYPNPNETNPDGVPAVGHTPGSYDPPTMYDAPAYQAPAPAAPGLGGPVAPPPTGYQAPPTGFPPSPAGPGGPEPSTEPGWRERQAARRAERSAQELEETEEYVEDGRHRRGTVRVVRGRRSRRIVRRIDTWTVFKVSIVFYLCVFIVVMISSAVLWNLSQAFNFTHDIEKSIKTLFGYSTFTLHPGPMFEYMALGGVVLAVVGTLVNLLAAMVYNLIADVIGGVQVIVVTEEL